VDDGDAVTQSGDTVLPGGAVQEEVDGVVGVHQQVGGGDANVSASVPVSVPRVATRLRSASDVTTLWRYTNTFIIIIIFYPR